MYDRVLLSFMSKMQGGEIYGLILLIQHFK